MCRKIMRGLDEDEIDIANELSTSGLVLIKQALSLLGNLLLVNTGVLIKRARGNLRG